MVFLLTQVGALAAMRFAERLAPHGLSPAHVGLLRAIDAEPGRSQQAVSRQLGILPSRLVALVDEAESADLVERRRNSSDRRNYSLYLTDTGAKRLRDLFRIAQANGADFLEPLDDQERVELGRLLGRLVEHHGMTPGVHPGYGAMSRRSAAGPGAG